VINLKKALVTGGCGFIGSNLVEFLLSKGFEVRILDSLTYAGKLKNIENFLENVEFFEGDMRNYEFVHKAVDDCDIIFHLAAKSHVHESISNPMPFLEVNLMGTANVLEAGKMCDTKKIVYVSSSEVYGDAVYVPMDEKHPLNPRSPYAASKAAADRLCYAYYVTYGTPITIIRPFNQYGPKQHVEKVIPRFITNALRGKPLTVAGSGRQTRDWVFVKDTCNGLVKAASKKKAIGEVFNLGSGEEVSVIEIAKKIIKLCKGKCKIEFIDERSGQVMKHISDSSKAKKLLGWKAKTKFDEGLANTFEWYEKTKSFWAER
jgi:dTDP-glucose 4,6-dehydratase